MTPVNIHFAEVDAQVLADQAGLVAVRVAPDGKMDTGARRVNVLTRKALARAVESDAWDKLDEGGLLHMGYPAGMAADGVIVMKLGPRPDAATARKAGAGLAKALGTAGMTVVTGPMLRAEDLMLGLALRAYRFEARKSSESDPLGGVTLMTTKPEETAQAAKAGMAVVEGVFFARDLTNEPANFLTTDDFAARLAAMQDLGLDVEILEEPELEKLGMGALLSVGQGSASPTKVVVMQWNGGGDEAPFALVGKGVVFDTGGISLKPSAGMEAMTMDMGGAGVVSGVMRTLALRQAKANVVGLVGLVENMPSGTATRPGDVVTAMNGTTIEVNNTDAEGRLVLADVLHYCQDRFAPSGIVDLATLTGAMITALGHEMAGVFSNSDDLAGDFLKAADAEGEGAWRMPMGPAYDKMLKSQTGDIKNSMGRPAGSITAAQFLGRFVKDDVPWVHLDIAGVASTPAETDFAPKGISGWGVRALNRLIADRYEA